MSVLVDLNARPTLKPMCSKNSFTDKIHHQYEGSKNGRENSIYSIFVQKIAFQDLLSDSYTQLLFVPKACVMSPKDLQPYPPSLRSIAIAEVVALASEPVSLNRIAITTGIPKPTVHRFINTLVESRLLLREAHRKAYSAGERLSAMAIGIMSHSSLRNERRSILRSLVDQIGETCNFTTVDVNDVVYVDRVEAAWPLRLH